MAIIRRKSHTYKGHIQDFFKLLFSSSWNKTQYIEQLEKEISLHANVPYVACTSFGLHALAIILSYYKFNSETELLIPGYTAKVVQQCLDELNIKYQCVDIEPNRGTMCPKDFKRKISKDTKGVLITHLLGNACSEEIFAIARERNLVIIEDCAHAQGAFCLGQALGTLGNAGFFSFSYSKLINTYTGGALITKDEQLYNYARQDIIQRPHLKRIQLLRKFLMGHVENIIGIPLLTFIFGPLLRSNGLLKQLKNLVNIFTRKRMTNFYQYSNTQAYLGLVQLKELQNVLKRKEWMASYIQDRTKIDFLEKKAGDVYYNLIAVVPSAENFHIELSKQGLDTGYGSSIMEIVSGAEDLPGCRMAYQHYLLLPNYVSLKTHQLDRIIKLINHVQGQNGK